MDDDIFIHCTQCRTRISVTGNPNNPTLRVDGNGFEVIVRLTPETRPIAGRAACLAETEA